MPAVPITNDRQYEKAIEVLTRIGGTWQGVGGDDEPYLLVSPRQYDALVEAKVIAQHDTNTGAQRGKNSHKTRKS
jgi:hypothetical protein